MVFLIERAGMPRSLGARHLRAGVADEKKPRTLSGAFGAALFAA
jgi:hypothetical protein